MSIAPVGSQYVRALRFPITPLAAAIGPGNCFSTIAGARTVADEVNKLGRFDAEIHMRTSVSALAELMVRIDSPPRVGSTQWATSARQSRQNYGCLVAAKRGNY